MEEKQKLDFFLGRGVGEKKFLRAFQEWRDRYWRWGVVGLDKLRISPNRVTFFGFVSILVFFYLLPTHLNWAVVFLILHFVADGLDGPLARFQKKASAKGAFLDLAADNVGGIILVLALIRVGTLSDLIGAAYLTLTLLSFILVDWARQAGLGEISVWKGRWFLVGALGGYFFLGINLIVEMTVVFSAYLLVMNFILGLKIYRAL